MTPLRILLIEDDLLIGGLLTDMLENMDHVVCGIETTEHAAVAAALRIKPDLLIVDARLRSGSGRSAVETICRTVPTPHFFVSGDRRSVSLGNALVLQKPYTQRDLVQAIQETMARTVDA